ncbi:MAG: hypothetical protein JNL60_05635 [Bacteroidia bacterium]|nr:hypothetical protein [Bacteroidia bacterium]
MKKTALIVLLVAAFISCKKKEDPKEDNPATPVTPGSTCPTCSFPDTVWGSASSVGPRLIFKFKFDSTQVRLNNLGQPSLVPAGNAGQSPKFNGMSAHYIELAQDDFTQVGGGSVLYKAEETECGGSKAIVFCKSVVCKDGDVFYSVPLKDVKAGNYKWLRVSLAYQNYDIKVRSKDAGIIDGTLASFVGFNTYVSKYKMKNAVMTPTISPETNKLQGYWGFYTKVFGVEFKMEGQAPATTVVNPNPNSPIPAGSCLVTGEFYNSNASQLQPLSITGNETQDIIITVSLSTNKSFEWKEITADGLYQPEIGETVVDMGLRGMIPKY